MQLEDSLSIKLGKYLLWGLTSLLVIIEFYERLKIDTYSFILLILCTLLILAITELFYRNKGIFKYKRGFK